MGSIRFYWAGGTPHPGASQQIHGSLPMAYAYVPERVPMMSSENQSQGVPCKYGFLGPAFQAYHIGAQARVCHGPVKAEQTVLVRSLMAFEHCFALVGALAMRSASSRAVARLGFEMPQALNDCSGAGRDGNSCWFLFFLATWRRL